MVRKNTSKENNHFSNYFQFKLLNNTFKNIIIKNKQQKYILNNQLIFKLLENK